MLTEDYIVRMIRDMGQMLARVLGSQAWEPDRCAEVWEAAAGDCPPLLEELKALLPADAAAAVYRHFHKEETP